MKMSRNYFKKAASLALAIVTFSLVSCSQADPIFDCDKEQTTSIDSKDGRFRATVLLVQCGATTADATWILLSPTSRNPDPEIDKAAVFDGTDIRVKWVDNLLDISFGDARLFKSASSLHGVSVQYTSLTIRQQPQ